MERHNDNKERLATNINNLKTLWRDIMTKPACQRYTSLILNILRFRKRQETSWKDRIFGQKKKNE